MLKVDSVIDHRSKYDKHVTRILSYVVIAGTIGLFVYYKRYEKQQAERDGYKDKDLAYEEELSLSKLRELNKKLEKNGEGNDFSKSLKSDQDFETIRYHLHWAKLFDDDDIFELKTLVDIELIQLKTAHAISF